MPKARKELEATLLFSDGYFLRMRVWEVSAPVPPGEHRFKYSLFYGRPGERVVLFNTGTGAKYVAFAGCGHWWPAQRPAETAALLEEHWQR